ncbi:FRG domain-containing protein [Marinomonas sp. 2405UD66-6]|uniref:FRG domain-containing protein n=1 Tax=Marinomonas sp. 2405UD66-6 TaxID=3391834 RepID=UPI0039C8F410
MSQKDISSRFSGHDWHLEYTGNGCTADIHCKSWNGFLDFLHHEKTMRENQLYIYRGQSSEKWKLEPTLKRKKLSIDTQSIEEETLKSFQLHCLGRRGHNPPKLSESEWWALGQHFGLDTPLLDWSDSPYIAAFFAFNSDTLESENVVIWLLNKKINDDVGAKKLKRNQRIEILTPYLDENARLINQRGLFVRTPNMQCISEWAACLESTEVISLGRILIPSSEKKFALDSLDKMNINNYSLFPDLSGSAKHANYITNRNYKKL